MQFKATSSGRDGIRLLGGVSASPSEEEGSHMASVVVEGYFPNTTYSSIYFLFLPSKCVLQSHPS